MKWSTNCKILSAGAVLLAAAFLISLTPWYRAYIAHDHRWTCAKLRKVIEWNYGERLREKAGDQSVDARALLEQVVRDSYSAKEIAVIEEKTGTETIYLMDGLCRDGGTFRAEMNVDGNVYVRCDHEGHDVDYTALPEF